jgi:hypothetical protein
MIRKVIDMNMELTDIKIGMKYSEIRKNIQNTENLVISALPSFCGSDYECAENLETKEKIYVLYDYDTDNITDVTNDYYKAVNTERAERNLKEILYNNGY